MHVRSRLAAQGAIIALALNLASAGQLFGAAAPPARTPTATIERGVAAELAQHGSATAWIVLRAKADLSPAFSMSNWDARGRFVYERLNAVARQSQAGLRAYLSARKLDYQPFWILNAIRLHADAATFGAVAARSDVEKIIPDVTFSIPPVSPGVAEAAINSVEWGIDRINAPQVWSTYVVHGEGIVVATIDTGVRYNHPALVNQYRGNTGGGTFDHNYNWYDPSLVCGSPSLAPCDNNGHGTHTMGTIVGDDGLGNQVGVAPGAKWIAAKGCESGSCSTTALLNSGQWMLAPTRLDGTLPDASKRPNLVSNSWGSSGGQTFYQATVNAWVASGIFPVFANGNAGPGCGSVGSPGDYTNSYGVGAFDSGNLIAGFSSRGAALSGELKPNISAPGVNIRSSWSDGAWNTISGTSMATPHVAGGVALMLSAAPSLIGDINQTRSILDATAINMNDTTCGGTLEDNNVWGEGRLDVMAAVTASPRGATGTLTGTVTVFGSATPIPGATVSVTGPSTRSTTTSASGVYSMTLPIGTYAVTGARFGYANNTVTGVLVNDGAITTQNVPLTALATRTLSGHVRDSASNPLAGATVTILGTPLPAAITDAAGFYSIGGVPAGSYFVLAAPAARCTGQVTNPLTVAGSNVTLDFSLPQRQDAFGYRCRVEAPGFIGGTDPLVLSGDDAAALVTLPFPFTFYGTAYTTANVTTNGLLSFTDATTLWANTAIPGAGAPNTAIYAYWDDLYVDSPTASILTASLGTAPNRQFVIEWNNVRYFGDVSRRVGFSVVLNENGDIQTFYRDIAGGDGLEMGNSATVGIENQAGTVALQYAFNEAVLSTGLAVRYYIPSGGGNTAPVAGDDFPVTNEDTSVNVVVLSNDTDIDGDPLTVAAGSVSDPPHGTAALQPDNTITYTPDLNYNGPDSFTYLAWDGTAVSNLATVNVTVNAANDAPTVVVEVSASSACLSDTLPIGRIVLTASDPDGDALTWVGQTSSTTKVLANSGIGVVGSAPTWLLTATGTGAKGSSTITVTVRDVTLSASATIRFTVGTGGVNTLNGTAGPDMLFGLGGNDTLRGNAGVDLLCGGAGNDSLYGGSEADYFGGGSGTDTYPDLNLLQDLYEPLP